MFKKEITNTIFLHELLKKDFDENMLAKAISSKKIDINFQDDDNNSFLNKCIKLSKYKISIWLIENGIDVTLINDDNQTAFDLTLKYGNSDILNKILKKSQSFNLNEKDDEGRTIIQNLVVNGQNAMAKVLISHGANLNNIDNQGRNIVYDALSYGDENFIRYITKLNTLDLDIIDEHGNTIMHHSQVLKDDEIAKDLLVSGANPIIKNNDGDSFLITTALRGDEAESLIDVLIENSTGDHSANVIMKELIEVSTQFKDDQTDLRDRLLNTAKKSMKAGAVLLKDGNNDDTGLINAAKLCDFDLVSLLLTSSCDIDQQNEFGNTALIESIFNGMKGLKVILLLIKNGADTTIKNNKNQTIYELLNLIIMHNSGAKIITDYELLFRVEKHGNYFELLHNILKNDKADLEYLDSQGQPIFFSPLLNNEFTLFKLYIKHGISIHILNRAKHNIFFEYVNKAFLKDQYDKNFRDNLSSLLSLKVDKNSQDGLGWTIVHKIITTNCNEELFKTLTSIALFDLKKTDNLGRTVLHSAIWSNKNNIAKILHSLDNEIKNIADNYGLLPMDYAALRGSQEMVLFLLKNKSNVKSSKHVTDLAIKKFSPMLKNLKKLKEGLPENDKDTIRHIDIIIRKVMKDFKII